jgi:thermopsin
MLAVAGLVTFVMLSTGLGISGLAAAPHAASPPAARASAAVAVAPAVGAAPLTDAQKLALIHADLAKSHVPIADVHYPAIPLEGSHPAQPISPVQILYPSAPAPMGISDIGVRDVGGSPSGYILNTTSAEGTIAFNNAQSVYVDGDGPDMFGVQLNSVAVNVTLFGNSTYQFWCQNFVSYTSSSGQLAFGDNIWNFSNSNGLISPNVFYAHSSNGTLYEPIFYYAIGPTFTIHYPFAVTFYLNSTTIDSRPAIFFNYTLSNATNRTSGSFDYVIFNSSASASPTPVPPAEFQMNGVAYDPIGLVNDIELDLVGNDDGDTTTFYQLSANLTIDYWNASSAQYDPVPSAMNSGTDTGETSDGVASFYTSAIPNDAQLELGPSFLNGLWNTSTAPGERTISLTVDPANALILVNPGHGRDSAAAQWVMSSPTGVTNFAVPNTGTYYLDLRLSDYSPAFDMLASGSNENATTRYTNLLAAAPELGIYTPLIIWGDIELTVMSIGGNGTVTNPYILPSTEPGQLDPEYAQWNDFQFPVFPGLLLVDTSAYVLVQPAPFTIVYPGWMLSQIQSDGLPYTNNLQLEFWQVSNVTVSGGTDVTGWLSYNLPTVYPLGAIIFWNSSGNLISGNTFADQGQSIAMFGGTNNTIWGNTFINTSVPATQNDIFQAPFNTTGIYEAESGDLIYNNYFGAMPVPGYTANYNPLSCQINCTSAYYLDQWNVPRENTSAILSVLGQNLSGSIIGTSYQGGNYWANYGNASNPYGVLPYDDSGWIFAGGDYVPLVSVGLYNLTFTETGLPTKTVWNVSIPSIGNYSTNSPTVQVVVPNGTYAYSVPEYDAGWYTANWSGTALVAGNNTSISVPYTEFGGIAFSQDTLPAGVSWTATINVVSGPGSFASGSGAGSSMEFGEPDGAYSYTVSADGFSATPSSGPVHVTGGAITAIGVAFTPLTVLAFAASGLPVGTPWTVNLTLGAQTSSFASTNSSLSFTAFQLDATGIYAYTVWSAGYTVTPSHGALTLPVSVPVALGFARENGTLNVSIGASLCANVSVDGSSWGKLCSATAQSLVPGVYAITAENGGYEPYFNNVSVNANRTSTLTISLVKVPSSSGGGGGGVTRYSNTTVTASNGEWEGVAAILGVLVLLFAILTGVFYSRSTRRPPPPPAPVPVASFAGAATTAPAAAKPSDWKED